MEKLKIEINYYIPQEVVMKFWECNIKQDYKEFDFIKAFESFESLIYQKVAEHGFLTYEDYAQTQDEVYNYDSLEEFEATTDYIQITKEDLKEALIKYKYERNKEEFSKPYYSNLQNLKKVYDKIQKAKDGEMTQKENALLFDELIHTEHETGLIFEDEFNIEELRGEFEANLKLLKGGKQKDE